MPACFIRTMAIPVTDRATALASRRDAGDRSASVLRRAASTGRMNLQEERAHPTHPDPKA